MHVGLAGDSREAAKLHELRGCRAMGGVTLVDVELDRRAGVNLDGVPWLIGVREVGVMRMSGIGADHQAARQGTMRVRRVWWMPVRESFEHIAKKAARRALLTFAANLFMIETGTDCRRLARSGLQQRGERGMAGGQVVDLAVGQKFAGGAPEDAGLRVINIEFKAENIAWRAANGLGQQV